MLKIEGETRHGIFTRIVPLRKYGIEGSDLVACVEYDKDELGEYPFPSGLELQQGQRVSVTPVTELIGEKGGSITTYRISPEPA